MVSVTNGMKFSGTDKILGLFWFAVTLGETPTISSDVNLGEKQLLGRCQANVVEGEEKVRRRALQAGKPRGALIISRPRRRSIKGAGRRLGVGPAAPRRLPSRPSRGSLGPGSRCQHCWPAAPGGAREPARGGSALGRPPPAAWQQLRAQHRRAPPGEMSGHAACQKQGR